MNELTIEASDHSGEALYNILPSALSKKRGTERPGALLARRTRTVKLCSPGRGARLGALEVGRVRMLRAVEVAHSHSSKKWKERKAFARANGTSRRASGRAGEKLRAVEDQSAPIPEETTSEYWNDHSCCSTRAIEDRPGHPEEARGRKTRAHIGVIVRQSKSLRRFSRQEVAEGSRYENETDLETMERNLCISVESQAFTGEPGKDESPMIKTSGMIGLPQFSHTLD